MIRDHKDLAHYRQQLNRAENALIALHKRVYAKNPRNYAVFAEGPIDIILELRAEIDAFLHIVPAPPDLPTSSNNASAHGEIVSTNAVAGTTGLAEFP